MFQHKNNNNQMIWLVEKVLRDTSKTHGFKTFQEFLDNQQYSANGILRYEKIFGRTFVSTGGLETTKVMFGLFVIVEYDLFLVEVNALVF